MVKELFINRNVSRLKNQIRLVKMGRVVNFASILILLIDPIFLPVYKNLVS